MFGISPSGLDSHVTIYELDGKQILQKKRVCLPEASSGFVHDIAVTENHYILVEVSVSVIRPAGDWVPPADCSVHGPSSLCAPLGMPGWEILLSIS